MSEVAPVPELVADRTAVKAAPPATAVPEVTAASPVEDAALLGVRQSVNGACWRLAQAAPGQIEALVQALPQALDGDGLLARLLAVRGAEAATLETFLNPKLRDLLPDPSRLMGMDAAVEATMAALAAPHPIGILADFDVDGATSGALLAKVLEALSARVEAVVPDRIREGYGPNKALFETLKARGCRTVFTLDCGATAEDALAQAEALGLGVIVLDHHRMERLPPCLALVNPNQPGCQSGLGQLAAVGVTFMFCVALLRACRAAGQAVPNLLEQLDLVALGTLCDLVPLTGLNRALVRQGLKVWAETRNPGLLALGRIAGVKSPPKVQDAGFAIGPRLNAPGRIGVSDLALRLLRAADAQEAAALAMRLQSLNEDRKTIERAVYTQALAAAEAQNEADPPLLLVQGEDWHPGVVGIVAGRLKERFNKPVVVLDADPKIRLLRGSGRSCPGVDLGGMVLAARAEGLLETGGGHKMAAGLSLQQSQRDAFLDFALRYITAHRSPPQSTGQAEDQSEVRVDALASLAALNRSMAARMEQFGPFGMGNPEPLFAVSAVYITAVETMRGGHIRCFLKASDGTTLKAMAFRAENTALGNALHSGRATPVHLLGQLKLNRWQDRETAELHLVDIAPLPA